MAEAELDPKWKKFEKLVYEVQRGFAPNADVKLNDHIMGADSKAERQIDISVRQNVGQYQLLIVIDCKDYANPLDVNDVGQFAALVKDVRANKGALISASGFTPACLEFARAHGIDAFRLVDTESETWRTYASIPVLLEGTRLKAWSLTFSDFEFIPAPRGADFRTLKVLGDGDRPSVVLHDIIAGHWNSREEPYDPGEHKFRVGENLECEFAGQNFRTTLDVRLLVERQFFFGSLPVHLRGLRDEQDGGVHTREMKTDFIDPSAIERGQEAGWQQISDAQALAVEPTLGFTYTDHIPMLHEIVKP